MTLGVVFGIALLGLFFAGGLTHQIEGKSQGTKEMQEIAKAIQKGAMTFLRTEYTIIAVFVLVVTVALYLNQQVQMAVTFFIGALCSAMAGWLGMHTATMANVRTAHAAHTGLAQALQIAFSSGMVMGLCVVSLGLGGVTVLYYLYGTPEPLFGFGFGASSIALFARVGGGIFTKAADVGADLVGKIEAGIPEDDPRNPAVIADNVGDNVGDVAGMGADLFESYVGSIIATMALGATLASQGSSAQDLVMLPLYLASLGIVSAIIGKYAVRCKNENDIHNALFRGLLVSSTIFLILAYFLIDRLNLHYISRHGIEVYSDQVFFSVLTGLVLGVIIGKVTEFYTSENSHPTQSIAKQSQSGSATNLIFGLAVGMGSTWATVVLIALCIMMSFSFAGLYGISIAAVGMLATLGLSLGVDAYGPVADNAGGIAQMAGCPKEVRERTDALDAVGNTTAAIGKGFAIGSAALTALALFQNYVDIVSRTIGQPVSLDLLKPEVIAGLMIGSMLPYLFSSLTMLAVGRAANQMVAEVRRQFKDIKGLMEGTAVADSQRCVMISTKASIREMVVPGLLAVIVPVAVGAFWSYAALGGLIVGTLFSGLVMAIFMANAGGAWDNAKKYIEGGMHGGKGSVSHKAAIVGDTVGDPFKDTAGPALNILIKLICIVSVVAAPILFR